MGFGKDGKGQILYDYVPITLSTLSTKDVISAPSDNSLTEDFRILKTEYWIQWTPALTDGFEGPVVIGMAAGGLTSAEIEEALEARPSDTSDYPAIEQVMRPVWPLVNSMFFADGAAGFTASMAQPLHGTFNPKWTFPNPDGWVWWVYNQGSIVLATGGSMFIFAKHWGVWVR